MNPTAGPALIELSDLRKTYNPGRPNEVEVLHGLALRLGQGEFAALIGPSGSGKSTLLNVIGLLERPSSGSYRIQGEEMVGLDDEIFVIASGGTVIRMPVRDISSQGRDATGVRVMNLDDGQAVAAVALVLTGDEDSDA